MVLHTAASVVGLLTTIGVGFGYANNTYAQKSDLRAQVNDLREQFLLSERRNLLREKYQLELILEKGKKLTTVEQSRYKYLSAEVMSLDNTLKAMRRK